MFILKISKKPQILHKQKSLPRFKQAGSKSATELQLPAFAESPLESEALRSPALFIITLPHHGLVGIH